MVIGILLGLILYKERSISAFEFYLSLFLFTIVIALAASRNSWLLLPLGILLAWLYRVITLRKGFCIVGSLVFCILFFPIATYQLGIRESKIFPLSHHISGNFFVVDLNKQALLTPWETSTSRLVLWKAAMCEISKRPITGLGIEVFEKIIGKGIRREEGYHTHNLFLNILVELGIPGLLLFLVFIYSLLKRADLYRPIIVIPLLMIFAVQMMDFFIHDFTFTTIGLYFLAEAGNFQHEDT
jgi:O-antigen ligase